MAYIPALKYHILTPIYDWFIKLTVPEKEVKSKTIDLAEINADDKVLDFGCGTATLCQILLAKYVVTEVVGLDVDPAILEIAKKKSIPDLTLKEFDGEVIPFKDQYFDKVISSWVFHHLTTEQKINAFKEIKRVLKPDGVFILADWGQASNPIQRVLFFILQVFDNFHTTSANVNGEIVSYLKDAGFQKTEECGYRNTLLGSLRYWKVSN
ncbi:methyltransferase domain-containing protein [uncultured Arcticibacterium sp.]|uniref:class I SAM-dependent methyltransferase n=1 Tax=uncultured Arcticibacterium sp. TaxID=2173042 RepID=UPI0030FA35BE